MSALPVAPIPPVAPELLELAAWGEALVSRLPESARTPSFPAGDPEDPTPRMSEYHPDAGARLADGRVPTGVREAEAGMRPWVRVQGRRVREVL